MHVVRTRRVRIIVLIIADEHLLEHTDKNLPHTYNTQYQLILQITADYVTEMISQLLSS